FEVLPNVFNLTITASDGAGNTSSGENVTINVTNNPADDLDIILPVVTPGQEFSYVEAISILGRGLDGPINDTGDVIGTVAATDNIDVTSFAITEGNEAAYFAIDQIGRLTLTPAGLTAASNNFEVLPNVFNLTITASDGAGNTSSGENVTINVTNNPADDAQLTLVEIYVGLFNAAPGAGNLSALENEVTSGLSIEQTAELLGEHSLFRNNILAGLVTVDDQVAELLSHFGFTPGNSDPASADAQAEAFFTIQINEGSSYGNMIFAVASFLSGTHPAEFNEAAALLANKAMVADIYSRSNSSSDLATLQSILSGITADGPSLESEARSYLEGRGVDIANTSSLLIATDNIIGTPNDNTFLGPIATTGNLLAGVAADTVQSGDRIDGGEGVD
ncbi:MAG: cadherin repeat domain-containing protein, partial [Methylococcales bacterium]|nr:cadherin repeat domain-containing protein [Methylococcales bacterium]